MAGSDPAPGGGTYMQEELQQTIQMYDYPSVRALREYEQKVLAPLRTEKGAAATNIVDQGAGRTYQLPPEVLAGLVGHLEACRAAGAPQHYSERQTVPEAPPGGVMVDLDLFLREPQGGPPADRRVYQRLVARSLAQLQRLLEFPAGEQRLLFFFLAKPRSRPVGSAGGAGGAGEALHKYGLHLLLPGLRLGRGPRRLLLARLAEDPAFCEALGWLGALPPPGSSGLGASVDPNSATVPALFLGSCKRGVALPYVLAETYEATFDPADSSSTVLQRLAPEALEGRNLVYELSLTLPLLPGLPAPLAGRAAPPLAAAAAAAAEAYERGGEPPGRSQELEDLLASCPEAQLLRSLLELLPPAYYEEYGRWRSVVWALAHTSAAYKPLALWFSAKYSKWQQGTSKRLQGFEALWAAGRAPPRGTPPVTKLSLQYWARQHSPARYEAVMQQNYLNVLLRYVYVSEGSVQHAMFAEVLQLMLGHRFVSDIPPGELLPVWWEFVSEGQSMAPGEAWKWRREARQPDELQLYLSRDMAALMGQVLEHLAKKREAAVEEAQAKYYAKVGKAAHKSMLALYAGPFKDRLVEQASYFFRRRGVGMRMDRDPYLLGVEGGVLRLAGQGRPRCEQVTGYHEWLVSARTPVAWRPFDPAEAWTAQLLQVVADIVPELDARLYLLMFLSTALYRGLKDQPLLILDGGGSNGKTLLVRLAAEAVGSAYATKEPMTLLTDEREAADRPNSALMRLKGRGLAYFEETKLGDVLNEARLKELLNASELTGNDKYRVQESFDQTASMVVTTNYPLLVNTTDHGTWRRLAVYCAKVRFCANPDPDNRFERKVNPRLVKEVVKQPEALSAFLSILCHFWERLQNEYGGELDSVPRPTIDAETERFRNTQDMLNRFITERVVESPEAGLSYTVSDLAARYGEWAGRYTRGGQKAAGDLAALVESSSLTKYLAWTENRVRVLRGCRVLQSGESLRLGPGERHIGVGAAAKRGIAASVACGDEGAWWAAPAAPAAKNTFLDARRAASAEAAAEIAAADAAAAATARAASDGAAGSADGGQPADVQTTDEYMAELLRQPYDSIYA